MKKNNILLSLVLVFSIIMVVFLVTDHGNFSLALPNNDSNKEVVSLNANINIDGVDYAATFNNSDSAKIFLNSLPLDVTMYDLNNNEKYVYLNFKLPANPTYTGNINAGDIVLFGDDCLVIFYKSFTTNYSYTKIGEISNIEEFINNVKYGNAKVKITNK